MNTAIAAASDGFNRPWTSAGKVNADSGLRLLLGGTLRRQLRWSPDPDAPAARALCEGEVRLAIRWVELSADDLRRSATDAQAFRRPGLAGWHPVQAIGCAEVVESRLSSPAPSRWMLGPLPVGTHQVLRLLSTDVTGCIAAEVIDASWAAQLRYAWVPTLQPGQLISGLDAVERAVRALHEPVDGGDRCARLSLTA